MDLHQLKTFVAVARERSITRASELLHLSQPAVSAHVKALEDELGVALFERTPRGMSLTRDGERLLSKAERTLAAHQEMVDEAKRIKGALTGTLRIGARASAGDPALARLVTTLSERCPEVEVAIEHATSAAVRAGIRSGRLDAGFFNAGTSGAGSSDEGDELDAEIVACEVSRFGIHVVAPPGLVPLGDGLDWSALAEVPWIYPASSACCGRAAERLFATRRIRPKRVVSVDREDVTRTLIASRTGVGLLHSDTAEQARARGEVELLCDSGTLVRVMFGLAAGRAQDPLLALASSIVREAAGA